MTNSDDNNTDSARDLVRQGERTVDNLKRLFAVVFALSFAIVVHGILARLNHVVLPPGASIPAWRWLLNIEMVAVFMATAAVFYHQSLKFLDIRYAKEPLSETHLIGFRLRAPRFGARGRAPSPGAGQARATLSRSAGEGQSN